jgi:8-oxo-dGTP pyrophosphatase MutT (NUDIX family)
MKVRVRTSVICTHNNNILVFLAVDPTSGKEYYFLPGGEIEPHETAPETAVRETYEETGYKVDVDPLSAHAEDYHFLWDGRSYECTTIFYRGHLAEEFHPPRPIKDADYNKGAFWLPVAEVNKIFSYHASIQAAVNYILQFSA